MTTADDDSSTALTSARSLYASGAYLDAASSFAHAASLLTSEYESSDVTFAELARLTQQKAGSTQADSQRRQDIREAMKKIAALHSNASASYLLAEETHKALIHAEKAISLTEQNWHKAFYRRAEVHMKLGGYKRASLDYAESLSLIETNDVNDEEHLTRRKMEAERRASEHAQDESEAREIEEELKNQDEEARKKKETTATDITLQAEERDRDPEVKRLHAEAGEAIARKDAREAIRLLERATSLEPTFYQALCQIGMLYFHLDDANTALTYLQRSIRAEANYLRPYTTMGSVLESLGRHDEAEPLYRQSIRINFDQADAWVQLALNLAARGKVRAAVDELRKALVGGPEGKFHTPRNDGTLLFLLGYLSLLLGARAEPMSLFLRVCQDGGSPLFLYCLARVASSADDEEHMQQALGAFETVRRDHEDESRRDLARGNSVLELPHWRLFDEGRLRATLRRAGEAGLRAYESLIPGIEPGLNLIEAAVLSAAFPDTTSLASSPHHHQQQLDNAVDASLHAIFLRVTGEAKPRVYVDATSAPEDVCEAMIEITRSLLDVILRILEHPYGDFSPATHARLGVPKVVSVAFKVVSGTVPRLAGVLRTSKDEASLSVLDRAWELARQDVCGTLVAVSGEGDVGTLRRLY
ncbi:hypothetical protein PPROV_000872100 [Pycnococcus provasolii]|uniref:Uncharacterized protein n=1 Tax=Pycnococcus provasolii TaxID=41880 RepID=A0A830HSN7_9CHLO|nr:hypothetical protein PPROV_000872100 [Pycnococcus provasolii]